MFKKFKFPIAVVALVAMIFVWKMVLDKYVPGFANLTSFSKNATQAELQKISISVIKIKGKVSVTDDAQKIELQQGTIITKPVTLQTGPDSLAILGYGPAFASKIKIGPNATMELARLNSDQRELNDGLYFFIHQGLVLFKIYNPTKTKVLKVKTATMSMGIRGTTFAVDSNDEKTTLLVHEGKVEVESSKGQPEMAEAGHGFEAKHENVLSEVKAEDYKLDWNPESENAQKGLTVVNSGTPNTLDLQSLLEREVKRLQNSVEELKNKKPGALQELADKEKELDKENSLIGDDILCLQAMMKGCEFNSEHFKNDVANLKNNPTRLMNNPAIKAGLEKDMEKAKSDIAQKKADLKNENDKIEADFITEQSRLNEVLPLYEQYKTADENTKKTLLNQIDRLMNSSELHEAINKNAH